MYRLVVTEKHSVAQSIAAVLGADKRENGYVSGNGWLVSWCIGHLAELAEPAVYDTKYDKWRREDLPTVRVGELEKLMQNLYEDKCTGVVPQTVFQTLMQKYEAERALKAAAIPELERKVKIQLENRHDADRWAEIIRRYTEITELDETILFELVDRIEVGETVKQDGVLICDVKVFYRYVGNVDDVLVSEGQVV